MMNTTLGRATPTVGDRQHVPTDQAAPISTEDLHELLGAATRGRGIGAATATQCLRDPLQLGRSQAELQPATFERSGGLSLRRRILREPPEKLGRLPKMRNL